MTETEREMIQSAIHATRAALDLVEDDYAARDLTHMYESSRAAHTAAIGIWCAVVDILRARKGLDNPSTERSLTDAINLDELFGEKENSCGN